MTTLESETGTVEYCGHHTWWCTDRDEGPHDNPPYCESLVGGVKSVVCEPGWQRTSIWVDAIQAFADGMYTPDEAEEFDRRHSGVQLTTEVYDGADWVAQRVNIPSGDARSLAALLVAAADLSDGVTRIYMGRR